MNICQYQSLASEINLDEHAELGRLTSLRNEAENLLFLPSQTTQSNFKVKHERRPKRSKCDIKGKKSPIIAEQQSSMILRGGIQRVVF